MTLAQLQPHISQKYDFKVARVSNIKSYFTRVFVLVTDTGQELILKILPPFYQNPYQDYDVVISLIDKINSEIPELITIKHIVAKDGSIVNQLDADQYFVITQKQPLVEVNNFTTQHQRALGNLMSIFHTKLQTFQHPSLASTKWMRKIDGEGLKILQTDFPDSGYTPYLEFAQDIDYHAHHLTLTTIHGDWHGGNFSFTDPPFLFDFDTLSRGAALEDIARTLTQWDLKSTSRKQFYQNFLIGYHTLSAHEIQLIPKLMMAQLYANYIYYTTNHDSKNAIRTKNSIPEIKKQFSLE